MNEWLNLIFRWVHVVAGVMWIGHLYFFNFVNAQLAKTYDADSKRKVIPELMPRALYWFRMGAAFTWITGFLLLGMVYYMGGALLDATSTMSTGVGAAIGTVSLFVGFLLYDQVWKSPLAKQANVAAVVSLVLLAAMSWGLSRVFSTRAVFIHLGAILGTIMMGNVWMRIWPSQRKIIAAIKGGQAPDAAIVALAGLRSRHNTFMSVPLIFFMVSNHYPTVYAMPFAWLVAIAFVVVGFAGTIWLYKQSAAPSTTQF
ncbi:MAG TPA: urate hydroxylase PuuD [Candidatus Polarisedimenticolia bacterium]|nr:urate hydroxylase PuuD [Candidatus Polarisedimenticolia bacterium]